MRRYIILLLFSSLFILTGCNDFTNAEKVKAPKNKLIPIKGIYRVENSDYIKDDLMGRSFVFKEDEFWDGVDRFNNITYKIKLVDMSEYLLYGYKIQNNINKGREVEVVSVLSGGNFLYDFIKVDSENIMVIYNNKLYRLKKTNDESFNISSWKRSIPNLKKYEQNFKDTALYFSIRHEDEEKTVYKTYYIGVSNGEINEIYCTNDIFLPRKSGFWRISMDDYKIKVENISKGQEKVESRKEKIEVMHVNEMNKIKIDYVGNDYMALEEKQGNVDVLKIVPVDNPMQNKGVNISDLLGQEYKSLFEDVRKKILKDIRGTVLREDLKYENIGLMRKNGGFWIKGRVNYQTDYTTSYIDFNTGFIPPKKMVAYDNLCVQMKDIKDRVPQAIDAYTSPNKDIAVIVLPKAVEFYKLKNLRLVDKVGEIKLHNQDKIIMVEWSTGNYANLWRESFIKNNSVEIIKEGKQ